MIEFGRFRGAKPQRPRRRESQRHSIFSVSLTVVGRREGKVHGDPANHAQAHGCQTEGAQRRVAPSPSWPVPEVGKWLRVVLLGHYRYYGVPGNSRKMEAFKYHLSRLWYKALRRRSQRTRLKWERMNRLVGRWLPQPRICILIPI